jgi:aryl-alcohol dehydrogenase-like predicted oxidoreductase
MQMKIESLLSKVFIGTANFKSQYVLTKNIENVDMILDRIYMSGIKRLDMSNRYIFELNDLKESAREWIIQYKVQIDSDQPVNSFKKELQIVFTRLNSKMVNRILIHNADKIIDDHGVKILDKLFRSVPSTTKFGVSLYETRNVNLVSNVDFVEIIQFPANVFDRRLEVMKSDTIMSKKFSNKILQARSVFLQGLLLNHFTDFPTNLVPYKKIIENWVNWNMLNGLNILESNLSEVFTHQKLDEMVLGINSVEHLRELIAASIDVPRFNHSQEIPNELIDPRKWQR